MRRASHALKYSLIRRIERLETVTDVDRREEILDEVDLDESPTADALEVLLSQRLDSDWEESPGARADRRAAGGDRHSTLRPAQLHREPGHDRRRTIRRRRSSSSPSSATRRTTCATRSALPWTVNLFHGQLKPQEKDAAVARFRDDPGPQLLVSTEAGGEGRNFQFCHILVNYDLPWNPMKVEQRIGRMDRIGQKHPVTIFNFPPEGNDRGARRPGPHESDRDVQGNDRGTRPDPRRGRERPAQDLPARRGGGPPRLRDPREPPRNAGRPSATGREAPGGSDHGHTLLPQGRGHGAPPSPGGHQRTSPEELRPRGDVETRGRYRPRPRPRRRLPPTAGSQVRARLP